MNQYSAELPEGYGYRSCTAMDSSPASSPHKPLNWLTPRQLYASAAGPMFCTQSAAAAAAAFAFDLNDNDEEDSIDERENSSGVEAAPDLAVAAQKQPLFEKPLTPSDVGKLNRLVIPKQHAEKCFPLNGGEFGGENGLLLSFEDEIGKSWRFRYSYWNSSQSYVLTKGWSRFVKEKRLDAGDVVVFSRQRGDSGRLFIGWRRRNSIGSGHDNANVAHASAGGGWNQIPNSGVNPYRNHHQFLQSNLARCPRAGSVVVQNQTTSVSGNSKRLRLFGVNLECQAAEDTEPGTPVGSPVSSQQSQHNYYSYHHHHHYQHSSGSTHMGTFSGGGGGDTYRQG